ncbi:MAG TPA: L-histidine N(alpha)-methyltransferase [Longimicrobiales bacterium]|nr:L-histidine N(alpha)-methyltransferase [Longimicrobiales bacterium]
MSVRKREREAAESVVTEHSYKYTLDGFAALARGAGLEPKRSWTDREHLFGVYWLSPLSTATS